MRDNTTHWINQSEINLYLYDVRKYKALTRDEETELIKKIREGCQKSAEMLIYANLRFVITAAKQYQNQGLPLSDLINEGNYGLLKAAKRYNYEQNDVRFLSYAIWWVKQSILQSLHENSRLIRLPVNVINDMLKQSKEPELEYNLDDNFGDLILPKISYLDTPLDDDGNTLLDVIENVNVDRPDIDFSSDNKTLTHKLSGVLSKLNKVERFIITKYFGLDGNDPLTLQDISEELDLTKERSRQIKEKAIKKLRFYSKELFDLL